MVRMCDVNVGKKLRVQTIYPTGGKTHTLFGVSVTI